MAKKEKVEKIENVDIRRGVPSLKISCKDCVSLNSVHFGMIVRRV